MAASPGTHCHHLHSSSPCCSQCPSSHQPHRHHCSTAGQQVAVVAAVPHSAAVCRNGRLGSATVSTAAAATAAAARSTPAAGQARVLAGREGTAAAPVGQTAAAATAQGCCRLPGASSPAQRTKSCPGRQRGHCCPTAQPPLPPHPRRCCCRWWRRCS